MKNYKHLLGQNIIYHFSLTALLLVLFFTQCLISCNSKESKTLQDSNLTNPNVDIVYSRVEENPEYINGIEAFKSFIKENLNYPPECKEKNIEGRVLIMVVIEKDGTVTNPEVVKSVDPLLDEEAIRVVKILPKFKAGRHKGNPVRVSVVVPIDF